MCVGGGGGAVRIERERLKMEKERERLGFFSMIGRSRDRKQEGG